MNLSKESTLSDVCFAVCTALHQAGTTAVLVGGSAATYYAPARYQSRDADFVITMVRDTAETAKALRNVGFTESGGIYRHPETDYTVEFPPGPLSIGSALIATYETVRRGVEILHVISRTDTVRDRLAAFYHWKDRSSLRTALDVASSGPIDLDVIERWSTEENAIEQFREFAQRLRDAT